MQRYIEIKVLHAESRPHMQARSADRRNIAPKLSFAVASQAIKGARLSKRTSCVSDSGSSGLSVLYASIATASPTGMSILARTALR